MRTLDSRKLARVQRAHEVVAVKKLVVGVLPGDARPPKWCVQGVHLALSRGTYLHLTVRCEILDFYFEEIRVFQAGSRRA